MSDDKFQGTARDVGGKIQDAAGALTGDAKLQAEGKFNQASGIAQQMLGDAKDAVASAASQAKESVSGVADRVANTASELGHDVYGQGAAAAREVGERVKQNPVATVLVAGAIGLVVGFLLARPPHERAIQIGRARLAYRD